MLKNFKYYAGMMDADGSITLSFYKSTNGTYNIYAAAQLRLRWDSADKVLPQLAEAYNVNIVDIEKTSPIGEPQKGVFLTGNKAVRFLEQIKNHCVIKKELAEFVISQNGRNATKEELPEIRKKLKEVRADKTLSKKDYPSRQWLAGYIDGDGCLTAVFDKKYGGLAFRLMITSHKDDPQGVYLINKRYGGFVQIRKDDNFCLVVPLKDLNLLAGVLPHLKVKRVQADLLVHVIRSGCHLKKNGATLESNRLLAEKLKNLKKPNRPQRLSEITPAGEATV